MDTTLLTEADARLCELDRRADEAAALLADADPDTAATLVAVSRAVRRARCRLAERAELAAAG